MTEQIKTESTTKSIGYSYATSPNAVKFKFKDGCYCVSTVTTINGERQPPNAIAGFATLSEAKRFSDSLHLPFDRYTVDA